MARPTRQYRAPAPTTQGRILAQAASIITRLLPRHAGYRVADLAAVLCYLCLGERRRAALANMSQVLGWPTTDPRVRAAARRCFGISARNFWDLCCLPHTRPEWLLANTTVDPAAWQLIERLHQRGQGLIVVTGHLGAFDFVTQLLLLHSAPFMILTAQTTSTWLFRAVTHLRTSWGVLVEEGTPGALRRMIGHLRRGGFVGLVGDRDILHTGRPVWFFGRPTTLPVGPMRIAQETGAPVVAIFCPRDGLRYHLLIEEVPIRRTDDAARDLDVNLATLVAVFERHIRAWPDQWVVFQRAWPDGPGPAGIQVGRLGNP